MQIVDRNKRIFNIAKTAVFFYFWLCYLDFWNMWSSEKTVIKLYVCGSETTWMLDKFVGDKGGLYGRTSRTIYLSTFTLGETEQFLEKMKGFDLTRKQILELYMILGGVPYYLDMLSQDLPVSKNEIVEATKIKQGGTLTEILNNLCTCDFIRKYSSIGKSEKDCIYQLTDLFSLFHLRFVAKNNGQDANFWSNMDFSAAKNSWSGYAFEQVCLHHTFITTYGVKQNKYSGIVQNEVVMDDLFRLE